MRLVIFVVVVSLCAASAAAHDPRECRTTLVEFDKHRQVLEESAAVAAPVLDRLSKAFDEAVRTGNRAHRHAVLYRHFVARYPELRPHLSKITGSATEAMAAAARAIICLAREKETP